MTARIRHDNVRACDLLAADHLPACPACGDLCPPAATVCECGERLVPKISTAVGGTTLDGTDAADGMEVNDTVTTGEPRCTCGGNGVCTHCVLAEYDGNPFAQALAHAVDVVTRPANVVELHGHSKRVS